MTDKKKAPVAVTTKGQPKTVQANGNSNIAHKSETDNGVVISEWATGIGGLSDE